jgi:hypothetical protein
MKNLFRHAFSAHHHGIMKEVLLMAHVFLGVLCVLGALWVFVEALNAREENLFRIRTAAQVSAFAMGLCFLVAGYWYMKIYPADKALILKGPWPWAHDFFMETKEHLVLPLLLLALYLPMTTALNLVSNRVARNLVLTVSALVVLMGLMMEGEGGVISLGVRMGLLSR